MQPIIICMRKPFFAMLQYSTTVCVCLFDDNYDWNNVVERSPAVNYACSQLVRHSVTHLSFRIYTIYNLFTFGNTTRYRRRFVQRYLILIQNISTKVLITDVYDNLK